MDKNKHDLLFESIVTSKEVLDILGIKRSRLSQLVKCGKLKPIKKNLYIREDIMNRKELQKELRSKLYRPKNV
jgi:hypothetical protein